MEIKQSTATAVRFKLVSTSDYATPETGATVTVTISKPGTTSFSAVTNSITEIGNGVYQVTLTTTETNTLGQLALHATATGAYCPGMIFEVVANLEADTYAVVNSGTHGNAALKALIEALNDPDAATIAAAIMAYDLFGAAPSAGTFAAYIKTSLDAAISTRAVPGSAMTLTAGERTALAAALEAAIINELDGTAVMQAIADLIASDMTSGDLSVQAIAAAVRDVLLDRVLAGNHDVAGSFGKLAQDGATSAALSAVSALATAINAKTINLPASPAATGDIPTPAQIDAQITASHGAGSYVDAGGGDATEAKQDDILTAIAGLDVGAGAGAYGATLTVTDGTDPLEGAFVRATQNGITRAIGTTDASGNVTFALDAGTFTVAITLAGYIFSPAARTVTGEEAGTLTDDLEMSAVVIPAPSSPSLATLYVNTRSILGVAVADLVVSVRLRRAVTTGDGGNMLTMDAQTMTTDAGGQASMEVERTDNMKPAGSVYLVTCKALGLEDAVLTLEAATKDLGDLAG